VSKRIGLIINPTDASLDDGPFDILVVNQISTIEFLRVFPKVFSGKHVGHPAVQILRGRQVRLEASGIVSYADGGRFAPLPMSAEVVPAALNVIVPASGQLFRRGTG
jgi:diacylglycerol kinase (ATP)